VQFAQWESDIVEHGQGRKQGALLEEHAKAPPHIAPHLQIRIEHTLTEQAYRASCWSQQADDLAQQCRFAAARSADQTEDLSSLDIQIDVIVNRYFPESRRHAAQFDHLSRRHLLDPRHADLAGKHGENGIDDDHHGNRRNHRRCGS